MSRPAHILGRILLFCALTALIPPALFHGGRALWYYIFFRGVSREMGTVARLAGEVEARRGGHEWASAVSADHRGITVLYTIDPTGYAPETWLLRLDDHGAILWKRRVGTSLTTGRAMAPLAGGYVIASERQLAPTEWQGELLRVDSAGRLVAQRLVGERGTSSLESVAVLGDGSVVAGGGTGERGLLVRADSTLRVEWERPVDGIHDVQQLAPLPAGGFGLGALVEMNTRGVGIARLGSYHADGRPRWTQRLPAARGQTELAGVAPLRDGGILATGFAAENDEADAHVWAMRVNADGEKVWERSYEAGHTAAMTPLPDGGAVLATRRLRELRFELRVLRLSPRGDVVWARTFARTDSDFFAGIARAPDGGFVVVGSTHPPEVAKSRVWIIRLDGDGNTIWERVIGADPAQTGAVR